MVDVSSASSMEYVKHVPRHLAASRAARSFAISKPGRVVHDYHHSRNSSNARGDGRPQIKQSAETRIREAMSAAVHAGRLLESINPC